MIFGSLFLVIQSLQKKDKTIGLENNDVRDLLFKYKKIVVSWNNVFESYKSHEEFFSLSMIDYLNDLEIAEKKSSIKISNEKDEEGNCIYGDFVRSIIHQENINDRSYALITKSSPWCIAVLKPKNFLIIEFRY